MPKIVQRIKNDNAIVEKRIITGMIVSKEYMQGIYPLINLAYFKNMFTRRIAEWCLDYYESYEDVPFDDIQNIFNEKAPDIKEAEAELISKLLADTSKRYEREKGLNLPYLNDQTEEYFKKRELEITAGNIQILLKNGDIKKAEHEISTFRKIQRLTSNWIDPFDDKEIDETFQNMEDDFFRLPGRLGEFLGNMEQGWLVGISGPFKKGKTWFLQEFALMGILNDLNVAYFSLEMSKQKTKERLYKRITGGYEEGDKIKYPCFDCVKNQEDTCEKEERTCNETLPEEYSEDSEYQPCTMCRGKNDDYEMATWFETIEAPPFDVSVVGDVLSAYQRSYSSMLKIKVYPRFSANISDIKRDLDLLEQLENFVPHIILIDYADILKPEDDHAIGVDKEDRTWIALSQLGAERHALVVAPTQVTKKGQDAETLGIEHTAKWVGKLAHVDSMLFINQTKEEKEFGIMRIGTMMHRHRDFNPEATVTVLQQLMTGQADLDSEF